MGKCDEKTKRWAKHEEGPQVNRLRKSVYAKVKYCNNEGHGQPQFITFL